MCVLFFFFQAEDGIRDLVRSRGLGDVYKRQAHDPTMASVFQRLIRFFEVREVTMGVEHELNTF